MVRVDDDYYKIDDATPTDCIFISVSNLFKDGFKPDLVISGINIGANMGEDITYSGTAAGAWKQLFMEFCNCNLKYVVINAMI